MRLLTSAMLFSILIAFNTHSDAKEPTTNELQYDLLLAGGGLKTCSSMSPKNCIEATSFIDAKGAILFQVSEASIQRFISTKPFKKANTKTIRHLELTLSTIHERSKHKIVDRGALRELFDNAGALELYRELPDSLYYALLDSLEVNQLDNNKERLKEKVNLAATVSQESMAIYHEFVSQASMRMPDAMEKPKIAVITASSRDSFEVADFYLSVFEQAGADVVWIPLDKSYQQARELEDMGLAGCQKLSEIRANNHSFYRERIYPERTQRQLEYCMQPELMLEQLSQAQGVFFNGGDQSLTRASLKNTDSSDSPALALIRQQVVSGKMIVGGTSAGTAVQAGEQFNDRPVVMLTNGQSETAMQRGAFANSPPSIRCTADKRCSNGLTGDDLTYHSEGGTGLFSLGLLDTHFSERDRETRLAVFASQTHQIFAFGVDEATALLTKIEKEKFQFKVIGENGVFFIDRRQAAENWSTDLTANNKRHDISGLSHFLNSGSTAVYDIDQISWKFSPKGNRLSHPKHLQVIKKGMWRNKIRKQCGTKDMITWEQYSNRYQLAPSSTTEFFYNQTTDHCSYINLAFEIKY